MKTNYCLTKEEILALCNCKNESEWNNEVDLILELRNGDYPENWYNDIVKSGIISLVVATWGREVNNGQYRSC